MGSGQGQSMDPTGLRAREPGRWRGRAPGAGPDPPGQLGCSRWWSLSCPHLLGPPAPTLGPGALGEVRAGGRENLGEQPGHSQSGFKSHPQWLASYVTLNTFPKVSIARPFLCDRVCAICSAASQSATDGTEQRTLVPTAPEAGVR